MPTVSRPLLSGDDLSKIRERARRFAAGEHGGDETALVAQLARDSASLRAHADAMAEQRDFLDCMRLRNGAWVSRGRSGWVVEDPNDRPIDGEFTRGEAFARARAFGDAGVAARVRADDATLSSIAARIVAFAEARDLGERARLTRALAKDVGVLLAHIDAMAEEDAFVEWGFARDGGAIRLEDDDDGRSEGAATYAYEDDLEQRLRGGLTFDEALRRANVATLVGRGELEAPAWLEEDRRWREAEDARAEEEAKREAAEEKARQEEERRREEATVRVTERKRSLLSSTRKFRVEQHGMRLKVELSPCGSRPRFGDDDQPAWCAVLKRELGDGWANGHGETPTAAMRAAIAQLMEDDAREWGRASSDEEIDWDAVVAQVEAFGPFLTATETRARLQEHDRRIREIATKIEPDLVRVLEAHGIVAEDVWIDATEFDKPVEIVLRVKGGIER